MDAKIALDQSANVQLVLRARDGNADAFGRLVRLYQRRATSLAFRLLGNSEDAGDVAQEAFVRAFRSLDQLEDPERFGPWLMRVVSNLSLNFRRSRAAKAAGSLDDAMADAGDRRRAARGLRLSGEGEADRLSQETHDAVTAALEQLPKNQRLALILFSVEGMPQKEVAEVLDCSVELVKWNVFQARKKLKEILADHM